VRVIDSFPITDSEGNIYLKTVVQPIPIWEAYIYILLTVPCLPSCFQTELQSQYNYMLHVLELPKHPLHCSSLLEQGDELSLLI